jgi:hypothetical protein
MIFEHVFNPKAYKNRSIKEKFIIMQGSQGNLVPFSASELLKKCKCHEDIVNICREMGKNNYIII